MRKFLSLLLAAGLLAGMAVSAEAAKKKKPKVVPAPVVVMTDAAGDAGNDTAGSLPGAAEQGFDLTEATIFKAPGTSDLVFTVKQSAMPADGTPGEGFRLLWHFNMGGAEYRFTVKSLDVGKPDAAAQSGTERVGTVYEGVARLEQCFVDETLPISLSQCEVLNYYDAKFDPATATETWTVPTADMPEATPGAVLSGGTTGASETCMICWVPHYAERSLTPSTQIDSAVMSTAYTLPKK
ncbi:MAG TPA: hypothetical protein VIG64_01825 [Actinomycetota bacterium]|jgi:hypothetical protein